MDLRLRHPTEDEALWVERLARLEELAIASTSVSDLQRLKHVPVAGLEHHVPDLGARIEEVRHALPDCAIDTAD